MQALHIIFKHGLAFCGAGGGIAGCVYDVAGEDFLPEGKAAGGTWAVSVLVRMGRIAMFWEPIEMVLVLRGYFGRRTAV
jgi:hypothetical protein